MQPDTRQNLINSNNQCTKHSWSQLIPFAACVVLRKKKSRLNIYLLNLNFWNDELFLLNCFQIFIMKKRKKWEQKSLEKVTHTHFKKRLLRRKPSYSLWLRGRHFLVLVWKTNPWKTSVSFKTYRSYYIPGNDLCPISPSPSALPKEEACLGGTPSWENRKMSSPCSLDLSGFCFCFSLKVSH